MFIRVPLCVVKCGGEFFLIYCMFFAHLHYLFIIFALSLHYNIILRYYFGQRMKMITTEKLNEE